MGSEGIRRRKVRRRPPNGQDGSPIHSSWQLGNSPFTFEGEIEGLSRFGRGLATASPGMRLLAKVVALTFLLPFMVFLYNWLIG